MSNSVMKILYLRSLPVWSMAISLEIRHISRRDSAEEERREELPKKL